MKYIKENFKTNISIIRIILYMLLGASLSITINSLFIKFGLIKYSLTESTIEPIYYYIALFIRIILSCIIGPFIEELLYRGLLYKFLSKKFNIIISAVLTTIVFSISHFSIIQALFALLIGIILIIFYIKEKNLTVTFLIHSGCNIGSLFVVLINTNIFNIIGYILISIILAIICYKLKMTKYPK